MTIEQINEEDFDRLVLQEKSHPIVVLFSKPGCPACSNLHPRVEGIAEHYKGSAAVVSCDLNRSPSLRKYATRGVPTVAVFLQGEAIWQRTGGATTQQMIRFWLDEAVSKRNE